MLSKVNSPEGFIPEIYINHSQTVNSTEKYMKALMPSLKDYLLIIIGLTTYAIGFTAFILPHAIVIGGLTGVGTLVYFGSGGLIPVAVTAYVCNIGLLILSYRIVGRVFVLRTIFGATVLALGIGIFENFFMNLEHPLIADISMSGVLGGICCGFGVGITFVHNGSSGGTDIVAAMVSKKSNVTIGRTIIYVDMLIILCSIFLPYEGTFADRLEARVPLIVYGLVVTFIIAYVTDMIINSNRQATQFIIFSTKWAEIADLVNAQAQRGVTVMDGMGWYSKKQIKILIIFCRKIESVTIFRIVKSIDENAFITQGNVNGVYGKGFDTMKIRLKKHDKESHEDTENTDGEYLPE